MYHHHGCGKTTILRDVIRQVSNGVKYLKFSGKNVGLVDERGEIASVYQGIPSLDVGKRTDIMSNIPKYLGIEMMTRSMGISVIATDEIGGNLDIEAIKYASFSGVNLLFTMHGKNIDDVRNKSDIAGLLDNNVFSNVILLSKNNGPGTIEKVYKTYNKKLEVV